MNAYIAPAAPDGPVALPVHVTQPRIDFLDGFRGIAILLVIFYHYYSFYASDPRHMYPFGALWSDVPLFEYGLYGVHLFFAVSGFVISLTLLRCATLPEFAVRRFARLWPTMLLCACITFVFLTVFPQYWPQRLSNFLPSLTFIEGQNFERVFEGTEFDWIDGAYWSLFVEVRFYLIAAVLYFLDRARFQRSVFIASLIIFSAYWTLELAEQTRAAHIVHDLLIPVYLPWFLFGIAGHCLWTGKRNWAATLTVTAFLPLVLTAIAFGTWKDFAVAAAICGLFLLSFGSAAARQILSSPWLTSVGVASYSLYLLHQNIGVTATSLIARYWSVPPVLALGLPLLVATALILAAHVIFHRWETPLNAWIVKRYRESAWPRLSLATAEKMR